MDTQWLLLAYRIPADPPRGRVAVWRKLKGLGAVYLQSGVCLLPRTDEHLRRLKLIENDISEFGGEAVLLHTAPLDSSQDEKVQARFKADRDEQYREFIDKCRDFQREIEKETLASHFTFAELEENDVDLKKLQGWLEKIRKLDFYGGNLSVEAQELLRACESSLETYAQQVFEAQEENSAQGTKG